MKRYYVPEEFLDKMYNPKYPLAKAAGRWQAIPKTQIKLPETVQSLITSFMANHKKGLSQFGPNGKIIYPSGMTEKEDDALRKYECDVFQFFKSISNQDASKKQKAFVEKKFDEPKGLRRR